MRSIGRHLSSLWILLFAAAGLIILPYPGIECDEALFSTGLYAPTHTADSLPLGRTRIPIMLMSYVGALKTWLYAPWFRLWGPSAWSLRLPVLLLGGITIWLTALLAWRAAGTRAAWMALALLSTDAVWLITTCFDWGPVTLQHLLVVAALSQSAEFYHTNRPRCLALACFFLGLGLWDKAIGAWMIAGLGIAVLLVYPKEVWERLTRRNLTVAAAAFCLGALPLVVYNARHSFETFRGNTRFSLRDAGQKIDLLRQTFGANPTLGFIANYEPVGEAGQPGNAVERASLALWEATGREASSPLLFLFLAAAVFLFFIRGTAAGRAGTFFCIVFWVAWLQMLLTDGAGGGVHHTILLWPLPALVIAVTFAEVSARRDWVRIAASAAVLLTAGANLLVTNDFLARLVRNGTGTVWSDAVFALTRHLDETRPSQVYVNDWGFLETVRMLQRGRMPIDIGLDHFTLEEVTGEHLDHLRARLNVEGAVFVSYVDGRESFPNVKRQVEEAAVAEGYRREHLATIPDRLGTPIFEVYRYAR
ncbi:MAG: glycosyltransferase family 39 protein [Bryobacterales bacterium]|nr:glycosyltransferase family 39 protein [Bryobacterales bacterium]